jgi:glutamyl-tRNA reductase
LTRTQRDASNVQRDYDDLKKEVSDNRQKLDAVITDANTNVSAKTSEFKGKLEQYDLEAKSEKDRVKKVADEAQNNIPNIVRETVEKQRADLASALDIVQNKTVDDFRAAAKSLKDQYTKELTENLAKVTNPAPAENSNNGISAWVSVIASYVITLFRNYLLYMLGVIVVIIVGAIFIFR